MSCTFCVCVLKKNLVCKHIPGSGIGNKTQSGSNQAKQHYFSPLATGGAGAHAQDKRRAGGDDGRQRDGKSGTC